LGSVDSRFFVRKVWLCEGLAEMAAVVVLYVPPF
jgi:hypothetical protein